MTQEELLLRINGDSSGGQAAVNGLADALGSRLGVAFDSPGAAAQGFGVKLQQALENPLPAIQNLATAIGGELTTALGGLGVAGGAAALVLGGLAGVAAGVFGVLFGLAKHAADAGQQVEEFSLKTQIAVENVGPLQFAVTAAGGSLDQLNMILMRLSMKAAVDQSGRFAAALKDLGINADAFNKMDAEQKILALGEGFRQGAIHGTKMADATALMSRAGANMIPVLEKMTPELIEMGKRLGVIWTPEIIEQSKEFSIDMRVLDQAFGTVATRIGVQLLPVFVNLMDAIVKSPELIDDLVTATKTLVTGLTYLGQGAVAVALIFNSGWSLIETLVLSVATAVVAVVTGVVNMGAALESLIAALPGASAEAHRLAQEAKDNASYWDAMTVSLAKQTAEAAKGVIGQNAFGKSMEGVWTGLGKMRTAVDAATGSVKNLGGEVQNTTKAEAAHAASLAQTEALWAQYYQIIDKLAGDSLQAAYIADQKWFEAEKAKLDKAKISRADYNNQLDALYAVQAAKDQAAEQAEALRAQALQDKLAKAWEAYYAAVDARGSVSLEAANAKTQAWYDNTYTKLVKDIENHKATWDEVTALNALFYEKLLKNQTDADTKSIALQDAVAKSWDAYYKIIDKGATATLDEQLSAVDTWYTAAYDAIQKEAKANIDAWDKLAPLDAQFWAKKQKAYDDDWLAQQKYQQNIDDIWSQAYDIQLQMDGNTLAAKLASNTKWFDDQVAKIDYSKANWQDYYDGLVALTQAKNAQVIQSFDPMWTAVRVAQTDMETGWEKTFSTELTKTKDFGSAFTALFTSLENDLTSIWAGMVTDFIKGFLQPILNKTSQAANGLGQMFSHLLSGGGASGGSSGGFNLGGLLGGGSGSGNSNGPGFVGPIQDISSMGGGAGLQEDTFVGPTQESSPSGGGGNIAGGAMMAAGGAIGLIQAKTMGQNVMSGMMTGAGIGMMAGPMGAAIGAGVGALVGAIKGMIKMAGPSIEDIGRNAGSQFGQTWSDSLQQTILKNAKALNSEVAGELMSLPDIIKEHPVDATNISMYEGKLHDIFSMLDTGKFTVEQGTTALNQSFGSMVAAGTNAYGFLDDKMQGIIKLSQEHGLQVQAITDYYTQQATVLGTNFPIILNGADQSAGSLKNLGIIAVASYGAMIASGMTAAQAMAKMGPALAQLTADYKNLGIPIDNAALKALALQGTILQGNPNLLAAVGALGSSFAALSNMGLLNIDTFNAMETTGEQMYGQLQKAAIDAGGSSKDALVPMQDYLHQAADAAKALNVPLDATTAQMIQQSQAAGIWKDEQVSATDKITASVETLVEKMTEFMNLLTGMPSTKTVTVNTNFTQSGTPPGVPPGMNIVGVDPTTGQPIYGATGGLVTPTGFTRYLAGGGYADGGFWPRGSDTVRAMLTPGEIVLNAAQQRNTASAITAGGRSGGDVHVHVGGPVFLKDRAAMQDLAQMVSDALSDRTRVVTSIGLR